MVSRALTLWTPGFWVVKKFRIWATLTPHISLAVLAIKMLCSMGPHIPETTLDSTKESVTHACKTAVRRSLMVALRRYQLSLARMHFITAATATTHDCRRSSKWNRVGTNSPNVEVQRSKLGFHVTQAAHFQREKWHHMDQQRQYPFRGYEDYNAHPPQRKTVSPSQSHYSVPHNKVNGRTWKTAGNLEFRNGDYLHPGKSRPLWSEGDVLSPSWKSSLQNGKKNSPGHSPQVSLSGLSNISSNGNLATTC
ncbi:hypothetical protein SKAU_G00386270 [Synaphobranchus kaupii]|uniref:Uncharacterized protein n=1 Tax=Synaphobranchus kaupii TaxID=118154 RepID=A0A9Q1EEP7_SYNKA|nr:hypothetical protein SKAU_G00386270 [Synaphobranchus kaupii]